MAISNQGIVGTGPGYGSEKYREFHLEYPFGGMAKNPGATPLPKGPLTISLWMSLVKPTNGDSAALAVCTLGGPESCYLGTDESGQYPELFMGGKTFSTGNPILGYTWHHFGLRSDGFNHAFYIDGARCLQLNEIPSPKPFDRICLFSSTAPAQMCGSLAGVKVWSALLDESTLFAEGRALGSIAYPNPALYAFWPLSGPTDLVDHSGNGRDLVASSNYMNFTNPPVTKFLTLQKPKYPQENPSGSAYPPLVPRQVPPNDLPQPYPP
jgi:hypothetical protein